MAKSPDAFRTISEVAELLDVPAHVLRFWEGRFTQIRPVKRAGGRRYYRPADILLLDGIRRLLHDDGMTIRGVQKLLREEGVRRVAAYGRIELAGEPDEDDPLLAEAPEAPVALDVEPEPEENRIIPFRLRAGAAARRTPPAASAQTLPDAGTAADPVTPAPGAAEHADLSSGVAAGASAQVFVPEADPLAGYPLATAPAEGIVAGFAEEAAPGFTTDRTTSGETALSEAVPMAGWVTQTDPAARHAGMSEEERNLRLAAASFDDPSPRDETWAAPVPAEPAPLTALPAGSPSTPAAAIQTGSAAAAAVQTGSAPEAAVQADSAPDTAAAVQTGSVPVADAPWPAQAPADAAYARAAEAHWPQPEDALAEPEHAGASAADALLAGIPEDPEDGDPQFAVPPLPLGRLTRTGLAGFERLHPLYLRLLGLRKGLNESLRRAVRP